MISLLSPTKNLNFNRHAGQKGSQPHFLDDASRLMEKLKTLSPGRLQNLMGISAELAQMNAGRNQRWNVNNQNNDVGPALFSFDGEVYRGLDSATLSVDEIDFANDHILILSGLYGVLRPLDLIQPYRLEMGCGFKLGRKKNLYDFWGDGISDFINKALESHDSNVVLNLASNEYIKAVKEKALKSPLVNVQFLDKKKGEYLTVMTWAKRARGRLAREIVKNGIDRPSDLKGVEFDGYIFNREFSSESEVVFTRDEVPKP